jgi:hypothetical protein
MISTGIWIVVKSKAGRNSLSLICCAKADPEAARIKKTTARQIEPPRTLNMFGISFA